MVLAYGPESGSIMVPIVVPIGIPAGTITGRIFVVDPGTAPGFSSTAGVELTFP